MVARALETLKPDAVLIEGPADANTAIAAAGHEAMRPPVALLVYEPERPAEAAYYPFAEFSPEWQAIRWALTHNTDVRFIDLPRAMRQSTEDNAQSEPPEEGERRDPLEELAIAAGCTDGEAWWGRLIEERRGNDDPLAVFDAIREAMAPARERLAGERHDPDEPLRESHMRAEIRAAMKDGFERIAVICGAWHAPVLTTDALSAMPAKADAAALKGLKASKTAATWIPWSNERLAFHSGYGAGVISPGWHEHLWLHPQDLSERWLARVARLFRDEGLDASPASVVEAVRLAESLSVMRGRPRAGLDELGEATLAIMCHGQATPMRLISERLIVGNRLGEVPPDTPAVPLQRDLAALQKSLRLKASADDVVLDLDQRNTTDLARSQLLHRLSLLDIPWGTLQDAQARRTSTFHELWRLQWKPEFALAVIQAARWGNTVADAAAACVADRAANATALAQLTTLLDHAMLADLPAGVAQLIRRLTDLAAVGAEVGGLLEAVPPLARVLRYGNVRQTDAALVAPVLAAIIARVCVGLLPACASLDDDAAALMRQRIDGAHASITTLDRADLSQPWIEALRALEDAAIHGVVAGRAARILLDLGAVPPDEAAERLSLQLSRGNDPAAASAWLEGFLSGSGMVLLHDDRLLGIVDEWVTSLSREAFEAVCPIARRTFAEFARPERRQLGEKLARGGTPASSAKSASSTEEHAERAALVDPVLKLILGDWQ